MVSGASILWRTLCTLQKFLTCTHLHKKEQCSFDAPIAKWLRINEIALLSRVCPNR